ncbi:MAG: hypothetical protein PHE21_03880 [Candidatus Dojkabacteria bacterium]|nr:hypothetical protein [Candidatus Dojkabacteria bacterium]
MNIELENNSAPSIEKFFKEREIESIVLDLDNTLFATDEYYVGVFTEMAMDMAEHLKSTKPSEIIVKEYIQNIHIAFIKNGSRPRLIEEQCIEGLDMYLGDRSEELKSEIMGNKLDDFYRTVPALYENSISTLRAICNTGVNMAFHSNAQWHWTERKVNRIGEGLRDLNPPLPFLATDITKEKDKESWLSAFSLVGGSTKHIVAGGDNVYFDLIPPLQVGCKYVVWLNRKNAPVPDILYEYKKKGKYIYMIKDIGDLRYISDNNLI